MSPRVFLVRSDVPCQSQEVARGAPPVDIANRAPLGLTEPDLATRAGTALQARPLRMAVLGVSAAQARTPRRAQEPPLSACLAMQAGTALQAPPQRMVVLGASAAQARTPQREQERHKLAHPAM